MSYKQLEPSSGTPKIGVATPGRRRTLRCDENSDREHPAFDLPGFDPENVIHADNDFVHDAAKRHGPAALAITTDDRLFLLSHDGRPPQEASLKEALEWFSRVIAHDPDRLIKLAAAAIH